MDLGFFVFTVFFLTSGLAPVCAAGGAHGDELFSKFWQRKSFVSIKSMDREYGTVRSVVSWSGTQISLGSIYPGDNFIKVGK